MAGKKYYLELLGGELGGNDHFAVGVYLPDGKAVLPISAEYLSVEEE